MKRTKQNRFSNHRKKKVAKSTQNHEQNQTAESGTEESVQLPRKKVRWEGNSESVAAAAGMENGSSEDDASTSKVKGRVAGAYYDSVRCIVYVLEDTQEDVHFDLTNMLLEQCNADVVLTSSKADDPFISVLQKFAEASGGVFQIRPHKEFTPHRGRDRLLSLRFLSELTTEDTGQCLSSDSNSGAEPRNAYEFMQKRKQAAGDPTMKRWNAAIRLANYASVESSLCISCLGALLDYLARERAAGDLDNDAGVEGLNISGIEVLTIDQVMHINADALFSLQIFENESHASIHSDKTKEGLSLFGILDNTRTPLGRSLLRTWLMRPSLSIPVIAARHDAIECFLHPENLAPASTLQTHLKGVKNIPRILGLLQSGKASVGDWQGLVKFTYHSAMIRDALAELHGGDQVEVVRKLVASLDIASFKDTGNAVNETIDWEESTNKNRICVRPYIDEELDQRKHVYAGLDSVLCKVAEQICQKIPVDYTASLNVVYFPQLGFLICVPMQEKWRSEEGINVLDGWSFQVSPDVVPALDMNLISRNRAIQVKDMDTHIGDLHPSIVDREIEIVQELLERILVCSEGMRHTCDVCAELDCLLAFAEASRAYNYCRPQISEDPIIDIDQGRHPLQEQVVDIFVPNNAQLLAGIGFGDSAEPQTEVDNPPMYSSIVLCTGANACGKSVYLKQVALIQYMAQVSNRSDFVPAVSATLGIVDKIFTRIQTRESVSKAQSAFMIDLNQVSLALRNCTAKSLILLDEFGKGTIPAGSITVDSYLSIDGTGLFCGVIKHLLNRGSQCPKVLAATHFHDVFQKDMLDPHKFPITFLHMQVLFTSSKGNLNPGDVSMSGDSKSTDHERLEPTSVVAPGEKITYLYRVSPGLSRNSHAAQCATMFGLPSRIAQRAQYVSKLLGDHELGQLLEEEMTAEEQENIKAAGIATYKFLAMDLTNDSHEKDIKPRLVEALGRAPHG
ncbi:DNA mismatch repair protein MutS [Suillus subaureus]|uniref:DNA mismatch repair protein MutS n=1 Tax=Suillus subaureus TaxID=48587 RepID=A0A9P7J3E7_9AGAM|nr:DNA mismatch repair protein MutS [Suillus subaureus]XP_041197200.1 DNA mismatch repair protein MutS [Suillus subaureus]KAG1801295.1 DNA mismatch repair protein MutS [Suillus subaureus]KAG1822794.1 DNA mismatch repair protein MutS [Suillus subaureus]